MIDKPVDARGTHEATSLEDQSRYKTQVDIGPLTLAEDAKVNGGPLFALRGADDDAAADNLHG